MSNGSRNDINKHYMPSNTSEDSQADTTSRVLDRANDLHSTSYRRKSQA